MMENCCYDRPEMLCLNLVKKGLLGEIFHAEAGYLHDLRGVKFSGVGESLWRPAALDQAQWQPLSHPRAGAGQPVPGHQPRRPLRLSCLDKQQIDGAQPLLRQKKFGPESPQAKQKYALGDVNVS